MTAVQQAREVIEKAIASNEHSADVLDRMWNKILSHEDGAVAVQLRIEVGDTCPDSLALITSTTDFVLKNTIEGYILDLREHYRALAQSQKGMLEKLANY